MPSLILLPFNGESNSVHAIYNVHVVPSYCSVSGLVTCVCDMFNALSFYMYLYMYIVGDKESSV